MARLLKSSDVDSFDALYRAALRAVAAGEQTVEVNPVALCVLLARFSRVTDTAVRPHPPAAPARPTATARRDAPDAATWASLRELFAQGWA